MITPRIENSKNFYETQSVKDLLVNWTELTELASRPKKEHDEELRELCDIIEELNNHNIMNGTPSLNEQLETEFTFEWNQTTLT